MAGWKARVLFMILILCAVVRKINSIDASGDSMNICDPNGQPQCQSISHATTIHIELLLTIPCDSESMRNDIRCDIDDMLNMTLSEIAETSTPVIPCTMLNDNGMDCRALITVLDNLMVSQNLTRQLFEQLKQLVNNGSNTTYTDVHLVNVDSSSSDDDGVILNLQLWEVIIILVVIVLVVIGFCITFGLLIRITCRRVRGKQRPTVKQMQSSNGKASVQGTGAIDLNYTALETTDSSPISPSNYEMDTFYPAKKKGKNDQLQPEILKTSKTFLTLHQIHDVIKDLPKLHEEFESLRKEPENTSADGTNEPSLENQDKAQDYVPTPHSHVTLSSKYSNDELAPNNINANYIKGYNGMERCYIVTHGPHQDNADDFWQMVWEQKPVAIAMLQQRDESYIYWPDTSETLRREFGLVTVTVRKRIIKPEYVVTTLRLLHAEENDEHLDVEHYWYMKWTAEQFPTDTSGVIAFLQEINETRKSSEGPLVIHCSDGLSCSGTLIAIDIARHQLENDSTVDISNIVTNIRQDRRGMILTKEQYVYIYQVLSDWTEDLLKLEQSLDTEKTASTDHLIP